MWFFACKQILGPFCCEVKVHCNSSAIDRFHHLRSHTHSPLTLPDQIAAVGGPPQTPILLSGCGSIATMCSCHGVRALGDLAQWQIFCLDSSLLPESWVILIHSLHAAKKGDHAELAVKGIHKTSMPLLSTVSPPSTGWHSRAAEVWTELAPNSNFMCK